MMMHHTDLPRVMDRAEIEAAITHQLRPSDQEAMRRMLDGLYGDDPVEDEPEPTVRRAMDTILAALAVIAMCVFIAAFDLIMGAR